jgi:hypothetical protein
LTSVVTLYFYCYIPQSCNVIFKRPCKPVAGPYTCNQRPPFANSAVTKDHLPELWISDQEGPFHYGNLTRDQAVTAEVANWAIGPKSYGVGCLRLIAGSRENVASSLR